MGWYENGNWDGLGVQHLKGIMSACIRALNERREAIGLTPVEFYYGAGEDKKAYPSASEFDGMPLMYIPGESPNWGSTIKWNMDTLVAQAQILTAFFRTDETLATGWTWSNLLTDIGMGTFPGTTPRALTYSFWERLRQVFNRLRYTQISTSFSPSIPGKLKSTFGLGYVALPNRGNETVPYDYYVLNEDRIAATTIAWGDRESNINTDVNEPSSQAHIAISLSSQKTYSNQDWDWDEHPIEPIGGYVEPHCERAATIQWGKATYELSKYAGTILGGIAALNVEGYSALVWGLGPGQTGGDVDFIITGFPDGDHEFSFPRDSYPESGEFQWFWNDTETIEIEALEDIEITVKYDESMGEPDWGWPSFVPDGGIDGAGFRATTLTFGLDVFPACTDQS